jgi:DnaJ homolog subfamily C member 11
MADDPYAPRSSASYTSAAAHGDEAASSSSGSSSSSAWDDGSSSQHSSSSSAYSSTGDSYPSRASSSGNAKPASIDDEAEAGQDEPLFGGTPFRNAQSSWAPGSGSIEEGDEAGFGSKDEFYTLLNVDKSATEEQIKEAYKALAIVLHPDKHTDPEKKASAERHFRGVKRAYEVLSNAETRGVYDHFGEAGLKSNWSVSVRGRTPADLQAEFEKEILARRTREAEDLIRSKGNFSATVDATAMFAAKERIPRPPHRQGQPVTIVDRWNRVGTTQLTPKSAVNLTGQMFSRGGMGGGNMVGTVKHQWSPRFNSDISLALIRPRILTAKGTYAVDANT